MNDLRLNLRITANADGTVAVIDGVGNAVNRVNTHTRNASSSMDSLSSAIARVGHYGLAAFAANWLEGKASEVVSLADNVTLLDSRIKIATSSQKDYSASSKELVAISLRTGTAFEANATIFSRINKAMEDMGGSTRNTTALTETLAQTMRISGASAGESTSTIRQLSQALASGVLRGDEFNSMMENAPRLAQALVDGMHVSIGSLRAMAEAGELNSKRVIEAIQSQGKAIDDEFKRIPLTVGAATENLKTAFGQYVLGANSSMGATAGLAQQINVLANNLPPIIDGIITLGKIAAAVFAVQMVESLAAYGVAKRQAIALEALQNAHTEALIINRRLDTAATLAQADAALVSARYQLALNEAQVFYTRFMLAGNAAMTARMTLTNQLNIALQAQAGLTASLAAATGAQVSAQAAAALVAGAATTKLSGMVLAMRGLNSAMGVFIAYQVREYLNDLFTGSDFAAKSMGALATWVEEVSRRFSLLKAVFTRDTWDEVNAASDATKQSYINLTNEMLANNAAGRNQATLSGDLKAALEALKSPQEVYAQKVKETEEALKSGGIAQATATALLAKYKETLDQANAAAANAKLSDAGKEIVKLKDQYDKLTLSVEDYNKKHAGGFKGSNDEVAEVARLANAIDAAEESKKAFTAASQESASAEKALQSAYDSAIAAMEKELALRGDSSKAAAMEYEVTAGALSKLHEAQKLKLLQDAAEIDNQALSKQAADTQKSRMDALIDKYNQLTMSAREYFQETLKGKGVAPDKQVPIMAQYDKNAGVEDAAKNITDTRAALDEYNKSLDSANAKTSDLSSVTSAVFDGALGGINLMAGAFDTMINSIDQASSALDKNAEMQKANNALANSPEKTANIAKYAKEEMKLNSQVLSAKLSGARQIAGAVSSMLKQGSTEQRVAHALEMGLAGAQMAMQLMKLAGIGATLAAEEATVVPYVGAQMTKGEAAAASGIAAQGSIPIAGFALMAAMGIAMAAIGFGKGKSAAVSPGPQGLSSDTGTVLGDSSAKSQSIDNTYQLLKDIQAENYPVLKSIDQGIADLHSGITDVITRLFQAGGLTTVNAPASKQTGIAGAFGSVLHVNPIAFDPILEWLLGGIFGGKQTSSVTAQGISTGATSITDVMAGKNLQAQQFAQIETKTDGGWFGKDKYSTSTQYAALDASTQKALNDVFGSMGKTMLGLADNLGFGLSDRVENYIIPALNVDLKGLNGEDAAKKLNGVISTQLDTMTTTIFGDLLTSYQKLGEGLLETAVRVVSEIAVVKDALATSGLSISGDAIAISDGLAQAAGGLKEFQSQFARYFDKFYSDAEKQTRLEKQLAGQLDGVNLSLATSRDAYRKQVESIDINTESGQAQYSMLIKLSGAADEYYKGVEDAAAQAAQAALLIKQRQHALDISLLEANGHAIAALTAKRKDEISVLDETLRATQNAIYAAQDRSSALSQANKDISGAMSILQKSVDAEKAALTTSYNASIKTSQTAIDSFSASVQSLSALAAKLKGIVDKTSIPGNEATDRAFAQAVLSSALILFKSGGGLGDQDAISNALDVVAKPSTDLFSSFSAYQLDFALTANNIAELSDAANKQTSKATSQLDVLKSQLELTKTSYAAETQRLDAVVANAKAQLDAINGTTVAVMTIADAINNLGSSLAALSARKDPVASMYQNFLGRTPDATGGAAFNAQMQAGTPLPTIAASITGSQEYAAANAGSNPMDTVASLYQNLLGRAPDPTGLVGWGVQMAGGASVADIAAGIMGSQEYAAIKAVRGYAAGGAYPGGLALVGEDGPELINFNQGGHVFTAPQTRSLLGDNDNNSELVAEIRTLQATVARLETALDKISKNTSDTERNTGATSTLLRGCTPDGQSIRTTAA